LSNSKANSIFDLNKRTMAQFTLCSTNIREVEAKGFPLMQVGDIILHKEYDPATVYLTLKKFYGSLTLEPISAGTALFTHYGGQCTYVKAITPLPTPPATQTV
jgi:hypothetical protein